jgi:hypothetical protein
MALLSAGAAAIEQVRDRPGRIDDAAKPSYNADEADPKARLAYSIWW